jgi:hypothetical protein
MALDDYRHGIWPAYQNWMEIAPNIPAYRSHLILWMLGSFYSVAEWFGITGPVGQVRVAYMGLGLFSLLGILGTYFYVQKTKKYKFGLMALYLSAAYFLMPYASTRAFGETIAISLVMLGFGLHKRGRDDNKPAWILLSFVVLGIATLFRFQVGLIYVALGAYYLFMRHWLFIALATIAGLFTLSLQAGIDIISGKQAFETLLAYFKVNEGGAVSYGVSPWYNTWLTALGFTLFPFSLVFFGYFKLLFKKFKSKYYVLPFFFLFTVSSLIRKSVLFFLSCC